MYMARLALLLGVLSIGLRLALAADANCPCKTHFRVSVAEACAIQAQRAAPTRLHAVCRKSPGQTLLPCKSFAFLTFLCNAKC